MSTPEQSPELPTDTDLEAQELTDEDLNEVSGGWGLLRTQSETEAPSAAIGPGIGAQYLA